MRAAKRTIDLLLSVSSLCVLSPVFLVIAMAVALDSGFPVLFSQIRVGRDFRLFRIWKFRSMRPSMEGASITVNGDARITRLGHCLRTLKLDELPQLWNVVRGEMSLVGPRPEVPEYVRLFEHRYRNILTVRPGITDLASLRFRDEATELASAPDPATEYVNTILPAKLDLADEYLRRRSLGLDLQILWNTLASIPATKNRAYEG